jgi:hypothetical protein
MTRPSFDRLSGGDEGPEILPFGTGTHERQMVRAVLACAATSEGPSFTPK